MINVNKGRVEVKGDGVTILAEMAVLISSLEESGIELEDILSSYARFVAFNVDDKSEVGE